MGEWECGSVGVWECGSIGVLEYWSIGVLEYWRARLRPSLALQWVKPGYCWGFGIGAGCGIGWANCTLFVCLRVRALNW